MSVPTDVLYDKATNKIVAIRYGEVWVLPNTMGLSQFRKGAEPVLFHNDKDGDLYFNPNALILKMEE